MYLCDERCDLFFFNDTATTEIYTLSLHDALPIFEDNQVPLYVVCSPNELRIFNTDAKKEAAYKRAERSEEHTSELQSRQYLVCRLLLEKKKQQKIHNNTLCTDMLILLIARSRESR